MSHDLLGQMAYFHLHLQVDKYSAVVWSRLARLKIHYVYSELFVY